MIIDTYVCNKTRTDHSTYEKLSNRVHADRNAPLRPVPPVPHATPFRNSSSSAPLNYGTIARLDHPLWDYLMLGTLSLDKTLGPCLVCIQNGLVSVRERSRGVWWGMGVPEEGQIFNHPRTHGSAPRTCPAYKIGWYSDIKQGHIV